MKILFELSGEHPTLPCAELACVGEVLDFRPQVAIAEVGDPACICRLALTHRAAAFLGDCPAEMEAIIHFVRDLGLVPVDPFAVRVHRIHGAGTGLPPTPWMERVLGTMIPGTVNLSAPGIEYRCVVSGDRCYVGILLTSIDRGAFDYRTPLRRAFFHPGVMLPRTARALVNLSCVCSGEVLYDPFCGTGGILIEADLVGACPVGSDTDPVMVAGSRANVAAGDVFLADASRLPLRDHCMDAIVTDLPYGQSSAITARSLDHLYAGSLEEIRRVLGTGRRAVVVTHRDISPIARHYFTIDGCHMQRVHRSLTRHILVLKQ
jgi:tRNA (guanine10-N2)-dimethyltransferase